MRPEDVAITADGPGVAARVLGVEFHGATRTYRLRLPSDTEVLATVAHTVRVDVGADVVATLGPGDHAVVPPDDRF